MPKVRLTTEQIIEVAIRGIKNERYEAVLGLLEAHRAHLEAERRAPKDEETRKGEKR